MPIPNKPPTQPPTHPSSTPPLFGTCLAVSFDAKPRKSGWWTQLAAMSTKRSPTRIYQPPPSPLTPPASQVPPPFKPSRIHPLKNLDNKTCVCTPHLSPAPQPEAAAAARCPDWCPPASASRPPGPANQALRKTPPPPPPPPQKKRKEACKRDTPHG